MQASINWTLSVWKGEKVGLIFNNQKKEKARMDEVHDAYRMSRDFGAAVGTLTFGSRKEIPLLQAADMIAYEMLQNWTDTTPQNLRDRPVVEIISRQKPLVNCKAYDFEALQSAIMEYRE